MTLDWYQPTREKLWRDNQDGSFTAHIYTGDGLVEVFTYIGDERTRERRSPLAEPIPYRGAQGLFEVPTSFVDEVQA